MSNESTILHLIDVGDALEVLRELIRRERQRMGWTQGDLARRSGVPATTISRLERTGLASTEVLCQLLFALNRLDPFVEYLRERRRLAAFPRSLAEPELERPVLRVRHRKEAQS